MPRPFSLAAFATALFCAVPAAAQDLVFDIGPTLSCLAGTEDYDLRHACIGEAANRCMEATPGGYSTVGMSGCIDAELQYWDARLNASYQELMAQERADDAELAGTSAPAKAPRLRDTQRAWIPFRDATCDYERSQWGGGTGGGPATVGCLLRMTAEQTLYLEAQGFNN